MSFEPTAWSCSFCGARGTDDTRYVGGLGALICAPCVDRSAAALAAPENAGQNIIGWSEENLSDADMLARLPLVAATAGQVDRHLRAWVGLIRERRLSYAEIGKALGVSRQAAWERFSRTVDAPRGGQQPPA